MSGITSWFDPGQNRESGGRGAERTDYAATEQGDCETSGSGPAH